MKRIKIDCGAFNVWAEYQPYRPAPRCSNHDDPAFSDPGDEEQLDILEVLLPTGEDLAETIDLLDAWDKVQSVAESCLARDKVEWDD